MMMIREKKDINPLLLKFGVALAISFAGFLYSRVRARRIKLSSPPPSPRSSDNGSEVTLDLHSIKTTSTSSDPVSVAEEKYEEKRMPKASIDCRVKHSPSSKISGDKDGFLLPEFEDLVKEFNSAAANAGFSSKKDDETPRLRSNMETPKAFRNAEKDQYDQEIKHLRNTVRVLREREKNLEVQLLEYYGLKEQETAVMEIQNRLKLNNMEAKLFTLKIESLRADNQRLAAQVADHVNVVAELEAARAKIKMLKKKLCSEAEQNREHILALQGRVAKLQDQEYKADPSDPKIQLKLQRLKDMEVEAEELRKSNMRLQVENTELSRRLESTQILANSVLEDPEAEAFRVEGENLRHKNKDLEEEIERLQAYRCSEAEELVYLKWINACLRYELRNYQPRDGKTVARDLSKTLSPKSEEKAKQLILEYANTEGVGEKGIHIMDFDYDQWSYSHASILTDSGELDDTSADNSPATRTNSSIKTKLFSKLGRIIRGKDSHDNHVLSMEKSGSLECGDSPRCSSNISRGTDAGTERHGSRLVTPQDSSRPSLDLHRFRSLRDESIKDIDSVQKYSDLGSSYGYKRFVLSRGSADWAITPKSLLDGDLDATEKSELVKYAEVLKDSHGGSPKFRKRSASVSFF